MKITDLLHEEDILLNANVTSKDEAIEQLVALHDRSGRLLDREGYKKDIYTREKLSSTGVGNAIAIPHAQSEFVKSPGLVAMVVKDGVDYDSLDNQKAKLFFMIAVSKDGGNEHLQILAKLCQILMEEKVKEALIEAKTPKEFLQILNETMQKEEKVETSQNYQILAVTACPTGIAHTYMAAKALEEKAKDMNLSIKVETNGSSGIKNALTKEEIEKADCIIVAVDREVEMARFDNKPLIQVPVTKAIYETEELLKRAKNKEVNIYQYQGSTPVQETKEKGIRLFYKHLMSGISEIIPLLMIIGILTTLLKWFIDYDIVKENLMPIITIISFGSILVGGMLAGYIASSIGDRPALPIAFLCGCYVMGYVDTSGGFIAAIIIGFVTGYVMLLLKKLLHYLPDMFESIKPTLLYPLLGSIIMMAIMMVITKITISDVNIVSLDRVIVLYFNNLSLWQKVILGVLLGGMMAVDMGGPINKTAYTIGMFSIVSNMPTIMAAVMAGGIVPPLIIAFSRTCFKHKFKGEDSILKNYIMACSFVTEAAIPYMKADKKVVFPACLIGSGMAGGLSMLFACGSNLPHGGLFVLPFIENPWIYLFAIIGASLVGTLIVGTLKK